MGIIWICYNFTYLNISFYRQLKETLLKEVVEAQAVNKEFKPGLAVVQVIRCYFGSQSLYFSQWLASCLLKVGDRPDSNIYVGHKMKMAAELGFKTAHVKLDSSCTEVEIISAIDQLNADPSIHGIIVQVKSFLDF